MFIQKGWFHFGFGRWWFVFAIRKILPKTEGTSGNPSVTSRWEYVNIYDDDGNWTGYRQRGPITL